MRLDCHVHTTRHSRCSRIEPEELVRLAAERGLDAVVFTEHHHQWDVAELDALCRRVLPEGGLRLYAGAEISVAEGHDVVVIGPPFDADSMRGAPARELAKRLAPRRSEYFLCIAHPFRYVSRCDAAMQWVLQEMDGVEMCSINILWGALHFAEGRYLPRDHALYQAIRERYDLTPLHNSDAHRPCAVGTFYTDIPGPPPADETALAALLKTARTAPGQNTALTAACLEGSP